MLAILLLPLGNEGRKDNLIMKNKMKTLLTAVLCVMMLACMTACTKEEEKGIWADAKYTEDTELGEGSKTVKVVVEAEEKKITFTIHTDETILGDALLAHELVEGEEGDYGLYIKKVNGILADYDVDQTYWAFSKGGEAMMTGVDGQTIADGEAYELVRTK